MNMLTPDGFEGPSFISTDLAATKRFWVDYLGGVLRAEASRDGSLPCQILLGEVVLEFYAAHEAERPGAGGPNHQHYAWDIEPGEYDLWAERAQTWQVHTLRVTAHAAIHGLSLFWDDPDGYHMELAAHYTNAEDMAEAKRLRAELIERLTSVPEGTMSSTALGPPLRPVGIMSHFTNSAPDMAAAMHFWIDFMGGELYSESPAINQVFIAGVLVDLFGQRPNGPAVPPAPGSSIRQQYRFRVAPQALEQWVERAERWQVRMTMLEQKALLRLTLVAHGAGGYHVGLVACYESVEALQRDAERLCERLARLDAIAKPFTAENGLSIVSH